MINEGDYIAGKIQFKTLPDLRATVEDMQFDKWYEFDHTYYHSFFQFSKQKTKHEYGVTVKQQNRRVFVMKQIRS